MLKVYADGTIELTRGDTARLVVTITNEATKGKYEIQPDDVLMLSVKKAITDNAPCLQKTIEGGETFHIEPKDTSELAFGKYQYDVQLTTAGGDVYTVIGPATLELTKEVSR